MADDPMAGAPVTVLRPTSLPTPANTDRRVPGLGPLNQAGATGPFDAVYERTLGEAGRHVAASVLNRVEEDLATITSWFGSEPFDGEATVAIGRLPTGPGAAWRQLDDGRTVLTCDVPVTPELEPLQASFLVAALLADLAARRVGWPDVEAAVLARVLATALYPRRVAGFQTGWVWLEGDRPNLLTAPLEDRAEATGCAALWLNHLHHQLGLPWSAIAGHPVPALADLGARLTGATDVVGSFLALVERQVPRGESVRATDNVFPAPDAPPAPAPARAGGRRERRVCLLTGASGTLGRHLCELYADRWDVAAVYRANPPAEGTFAIQADLTVDGEPERVVAAAIERFGRIDLLVNAAVSSTWGPMLTSEQLGASAPGQFLTNVVVPLRVASATARRYWRHHVDDNRDQRRHIVNVSSVSGQNLYGGEGQSVYAASKAALDHLTGHMALEFADIGVRANAIAPNSFPVNVSTDRACEAVARLDESGDTGCLVVVDGPVDRLVRLEPTAV